jgi:hypothetical protein
MVTPLINAANKPTLHDPQDFWITNLFEQRFY